MNTPEISVIVPVYKVEKYLVRCLDSILAQTFADLEIILVDDGSPDRCGEICDGYAKKDDRIRVIHKENGGVSSARNAGIAVASGNYIGFVDGDDFIEAEMYDVLYNMLLRDDADISVCGIYNCFESGKQPQYPKQECFVCNGREAFAITLEGKKMPAALCNKLYRKEVFENRKFLDGKIYEDAFFLPSLLLSSSKITVTTIPYYYYWHRSDSITSSGFSERTMDIIESYVYTYEQVKEHCPEALPIAEFRLYRAYFIVLDTMMKTSGYQHLKEYPQVVRYLRKNWMSIYQCGYLTKGRRISAVILKFSTSLYKLLLMIKSRKYAYYD